jgi:MFS transporter, PAT family, solute carrier family 33 (acetyl-CoA transportor), member 1
VQSILILHFIAKIGFQANDAVSQLKMVEKGLSREDLAIVVLIDFPFQILGGWIAGKFSTGHAPLRPWMWAFWPRLAFAFITTLIVYYFPSPPISNGFFIFLIIHGVLQSLSRRAFYFERSSLHFTDGFKVRYNLSE